MESRKVYVFGAGASAGAGLPLMSDFLKKAEELKDKQQDKFDDLLKYFSEPKFKSFNIEEFLGYLDMKINLNNLDSDKFIKIRLLEFIEKVIILSYYYGDENDILNYSNLLNKFTEQLTKDDTIISFNYDVLIDDSLTKNGFLPEYGIDLEHKPAGQNNMRIRLFKLHGSLNWSICSKCKKPKWNNFDYLLKRSKSSTTDGSDKFSDKLYESIELDILKKCGSNEKHKLIIEEDTFIIPPTWNKHDHPDFKGMWLKASEALKDADKIIFIGYSFPKTDIYFKFLLLTSLPKNGFSVEVVDPNIQNIAGRYLEIFKENISFNAKTFEEYILEQS
ncbi:MAG: hypothetical protein KAT05_15235 [Spirochaetes bacterium]|nr:hypothetical protein [Spirochaetota bacterium]